MLEKVVWEEVKKLLNDPYFLEKEYNRRVEELENKSSKNECEKLNSDKQKIENCIARLIDSYAEGVIEKSEFEPRVKSYKKRLFNIEQQLFQSLDNKNQQSELQLLIGKIETFSISVKHKLEDLDWQMKRDIFEALIKQVEIEQEKVNVVFRVSPYLPSLPHGNNKTRLLEDCRRSGNSRVSDLHFRIQ